MTVGFVARSFDGGRSWRGSESDGVFVEIFAGLDERAEVGISVELVAEAAAENDDAICCAGLPSLKGRSVGDVLEDVVEDGVHFALKKDGKSEGCFSELDFERF